jgi:superfamily II DNA or RNA helicase
MTLTPEAATGWRPGTLVHARSRDWLVLPGSTPSVLLARPLAGADDETTALLPDIEQVRDAAFAPPTADDRGDARRAQLLRDALRLSFRHTAGPFRSFASLGVSPRSYQLVPLMMAAAQDITRLLIADGVGIGKTVEAGLIAAELLATGDATGLAVLCSPQLAPQWHAELRGKFGIDAAVLLPSTAARLARGVPGGRSVWEHYPHLIVSTDFIKQASRRDEFAQHCPDLVIVDEAHTCVAATGTGFSQTHQRYQLLRRLAADPDRHLLLLTATPHSGDDGAWQNLLGLLDPALGALPADLAGPDRDADRQLLARYLVQRQRADIKEYENAEEQTLFPARISYEESYRLSEDYRALFDRVLAWAQEQVTDPGLSAVRQRVRWWSAIALLRSLASSPAAAEATLITRSGITDASSTDEADADAAEQVLDTSLDDASDGEDSPLGARTDTTDDPQESNRRRLRAFAEQARLLRGPKADPKLNRAVKIAKQLIDDGFHPIFFCRYIPTADYLAEHLAAALTRTGVRVESITGALPPEEREARVNDLTDHDGPRVLVATDCLSEGVNLQDGFTAVVHYDLAWNPTRHEQREGRVDRFGQTAREVRAVTYYGADNRIDGVVLDVLLRRHAAIKKSTNVSVPVPVDSATVMAAIWESVLLRGKQPDQLTLDLDFGQPDIADAVLTRWQDSAEREKASRSRFRQASLKPEAVRAVLDDVRRSLGGPADAERFVTDALRALGATVTLISQGLTVETSAIPATVRDLLPPHRDATLRFHRQLPAPRGEPVLVRSDPTVEALARHVLDAALDPLLPGSSRPARRAGVMRTKDVQQPTVLLIARDRLQLNLPGSRRAITEIAEAAQFHAYTLSEAGQLDWLTANAVDRLLTATPSGNVNDDLARAQLQRTLDRLPAMAEHLHESGIELATHTEQSHRSVRSSTRAASRGLRAIPLPPTDVLGMYVLLPDPTSP